MKELQANKTVLVVEDEAALLAALSDELFKAGHKVIEAHNGQEGLILALKHHPDLILLDIVMPKMDGMTMLTKLREDPWGKEAAVLILTNVEHDGEKTIEALRNKVFEYVVKTRWKLSDVVKRVNEKLNA